MDNTHTDYNGEVHTKESLQKRLAKVPTWYWNARTSSELVIAAALEKGELGQVADALEFIEYKLHDWATD